MKVVLILVIISSTFAQKSTHDPFYCYTRDPIRSQRRHFGIQGHYDDIRGDSLGDSLSTCAPSKLWHFARGGTRIPGGPHIQRMKDATTKVHANVLETIDEGYSQFCRPDADAIIDWKFNENITLYRSFELVKTGWNEMRDFAIRLQSAFPQILPNSYTQNQFRFRHTTAQRSYENLNAIADGLFGHSNITFAEISNPDRFLWPTSSCRLYDEWENKNGEMMAFRKSPDFKNAMNAVNRKLGLSGSKQLTYEDLEGVIDICRFEHSWNPSGNSAWCSAISLSNHEVFDFVTDLLTYHTTGYGGNERLFSNLHCHAMQDLLTFLKSDNQTDHLARFHIVHQEVFRLFFISLGIFRDNNPLHRQNFSHQTPRKWRTSRISSHGSNIVFIKHNCSDGDNEIVMMENERPLEVPGCERIGVCNQETFLKIFERFLNVNCESLYCSEN